MGKASRRKGIDPAAPACRPSLVGKVTDRLREELILSASPGAILPGERELAKMIGVGRVTIRRALEELRAEGWLKSVRGYGHQITRPRRETANVIGLVFWRSALAQRIAHSFYRSFSMAVDRAANADGHNLLTMSNLHPSRPADRTVGWPAAIRMADSLIVIDLYDPDLTERLAAFSPTVCADAECRRPGVSSVYFDQAGAIHMAVKYLQDRGHRRIGLVARTVGADPAVQARLEGFRTGMRWLGCSDADRRICPIENSWRLDRNALRPVLDAPVGDRPTALVVESFWPIAAELTLAGLRIPQDISLVSVGHLESCANWLEFISKTELDSSRLSPKLGFDLTFHTPPAALANLKPTTVHLPAYEMGTWAVMELARRRRAPLSPPEHCMMVPILYEGNTVARPAEAVAL